jgi:outer membrane protein assembly factor BamD
VHIVAASLRPGASARRGVLAVALGLLVSGCTVFGGRPETVRPAGALYEEGERLLLQGKHESARDLFQRLAERHPESELAPVARFLVGETYYRAGDYEKAVPEFESFLTLHPGHEIADLGQYRLARTYFDGMPSLERDQAIAAKALEEFRKLVRLYPESRYAPDALVKIDACRLRLAQKELWIAAFYVRTGKLEAALPRYDTVLKEYPRTSAAPEALFQKADTLVRLGRTADASDALRKLVEDYPASDWSRRARERQAALAGR